MPRTIALLCLILAADGAMAQGFYVSMNGAYGLGSGTQLIGMSNGPLATGIYYEGAYGSLGEGAKFGVSGGYMLTNHFAAELALSYWLGRTTEYTFKTADLTGTVGYTGKGFAAVPSLVFLSNLEPVNPYIKFGLVLGLLKVKQEIVNVTAIETREATYEETGGLAIGFASACGVIVPTGGVVDLFAEVFLHSVTYSPGKNEITGFTINGQDKLSTVENPSRNYEESVTSGQENVSLAVRRPFSSIGFSVGARITL